MNMDQWVAENKLIVLGWSHDLNMKALLEGPAPCTMKQLLLAISLHLMFKITYTQTFPIHFRRDFLMRKQLVASLKLLQ